MSTATWYAIFFPEHFEEHVVNEMKSAITREIERRLTLDFYRYALTLLTGVLLIGSVYHYLRFWAERPREISAPERTQESRRHLPKVISLEVRDAAIRSTGKGGRVFSGKIRNPSRYRLKDIQVHVDFFDRENIGMGGGMDDVEEHLGPGESGLFILALPQLADGYEPVASVRVQCAQGAPEDASF